MIAPTSAVERRETLGGIAMATGSLARVSPECEPGSVTGCSAVNNDLVVCAAQECCNVWEYSTQSRGKRGSIRTEPIYKCCTSLSQEYRAGQIHLVTFIKQLQVENHHQLGELAFKGTSTLKNSCGLNLVGDTNLDSQA